MEFTRGLEGKVIVITGGCGDIGSATVQKLARMGACVVVYDLWGEQLGNKRANELGAAHYFCMDQGNAQQIQETINETTARFNRLDVVICNAAVGTIGSLLERSATDWEDTLRVNVVGCAMLAQAAVQKMTTQLPDAENVRGKILFTSSWVGSCPYPGSIDYCASKAALNHLVRLIAQETAKLGIRVNAVSPGILDAGLSRKAMMKNPMVRDTLLASIPLGELGTADAIADAFVFLCSNESNYITGHILAVDGGCSLANHG